MHRVYVGMVDADAAAEDLHAAARARWTPEPGLRCPLLEEFFDNRLGEREDRGRTDDSDLVTGGGDASRSRDREGRNRRDKPQICSLLSPETLKSWSRISARDEAGENSDVP